MRVHAHSSAPSLRWRTLPAFGPFSPETVQRGKWLIDMHQTGNAVLKSCNYLVCLRFQRRKSFRFSQTRLAMTVRAKTGLCAPVS